MGRGGALSRGSAPALSSPLIQADSLTGEVVDVAAGMMLAKRRLTLYHQRIFVLDLNNNLEHGYMYRIVLPMLALTLIKFKN